MLCKLECTSSLGVLVEEGCEKSCYMALNLSIIAAFFMSECSLVKILSTKVKRRNKTPPTALLISCFSKHFIYTFYEFMDWMQKFFTFLK